MHRMANSKNEAPQVTFDFIVKYVVALIAILLIVFGVYQSPVEELANDLQAINYIEGGN